MKYVIGTAILGLLVGLTMRYISGDHVLGWSMLTTLVALPLVGLLITIDDDLPDGFSNPDGSAPSPWRNWQSWADLAARASINGFGFAADRGSVTFVGTAFLLLGCAGVVACMYLHRRVGPGLRA